LKTYQTIIVIDSLLKNEEIDAIIEKVVRIINNNGGNVINVNRWEKKRLAYEIKKRQYGYYVEINFEAPSDLVKTLERDYRLDENILRYLTIVLGKKALAYMEKNKPAEQEPQQEDELPDLDDEVEDIEEDDEELAPVEESELSSL
jgi:small subunit ribosomal protein S6